VCQKIEKLIVLKLFEIRISAHFLGHFRNAKVYFIGTPIPTKFT